MRCDKCSVKLKRSTVTAIPCPLGDDRLLFCPDCAFEAFKALKQWTSVKWEREEE